MKILASLMALILLTGCASVGRKLDETKIAKIKKGETTRDQVLKLIGSPDQMMRNSAGDTTFTYMYVRATAKASSFIPIVGAFAGGADVKHQMFMVTFGDDGVVKDFVSSYGATEGGTGLNTASSTTLPDVEANKRPK